MSCTGQNDIEPAAYTCLNCGQHADRDGHAVEQCMYSPEQCPFCGWRPCDGSC